MPSASRFHGTRPRVRRTARGRTVTLRTTACSGQIFPTLRKTFARLRNARRSPRLPPGNGRGCARSVTTRTMGVMSEEPPGPSRYTPGRTPATRSAAPPAVSGEETAAALLARLDLTNELLLRMVAEVAKTPATHAIFVDAGYVYAAAKPAGRRDRGPAGVRPRRRRADRGPDRQGPHHLRGQPSAARLLVRRGPAPYPHR